MSDAAVVLRPSAKRASETVAGLLLAGPAVLALALLLLLPTACVLTVSLTDMELGGPPLRWIGLANYAELLNDPGFRQALRNTTVYVGAASGSVVLLGSATEGKVGAAGKHPPRSHARLAIIEAGRSASRRLRPCGRLGAERLSSTAWGASAWVGEGGDARSAGARSSRPCRSA